MTTRPNAFLPSRYCAPPPLRRAGRSGRSRRAGRRSPTRPIRSPISVDPRELGGQRRRGRPRAACCSWSSPQGLRLDRRPAATGDADADEGAPIRQRLDAVDQVLPADRVEHHVGAAAVRQLVHALDEALGRVVPAVIQPEQLQPFELVVARGRRDDRRACRFAKLDRGHPDADRRRRRDQGRLPLRQLAGRDQALLRRAERDRNAGRLGPVEPVGDRPRHRSRHGAPRGVRAVRPSATTCRRRRASTPPPTSLTVPAAR